MSDWDFLVEYRMKLARWTNEKVNRIEELKDNMVKATQEFDAMSKKLMELDAVLMEKDSAKFHEMLKKSNVITVRK